MNKNKVRTLAFVSSLVAMITPAEAQVGSRLDQEPAVAPSEKKRDSAKPAEKLLDKLPPEIVRPTVPPRPEGPIQTSPPSPPGVLPKAKGEGQ
jgi:hypothetical protein